MATDAWKHLSDVPDQDRAYALLDVAEVRVRRVPAIVIPGGRDSEELRDCIRRVGLNGLPIVVDDKREGR